MKKLLALFLAISFSAFGTITEWYVNLNGSGSGDGTSEANAMSWANFVDYMSTGGSFTATNGSRFNISATNSYNGLSAVTFSAAGTQQSPIFIRGYRTLITDGYQGRTSNSGPLSSTNMPVLNFGANAITLSGAWQQYDSLKINKDVNGTGINCNTTPFIFSHCIICNSNSGSSTIALTLQGAAIDCDVNIFGSPGTAGKVISVGNNNAMVSGCRVFGNSSAVGVYVPNSGAVIGSQVFSNSIGVWFNAAASFNILGGNTIAGNSSNGVYIVNGKTSAFAYCSGDIIADNGGYGIDYQDSTNAQPILWNRFRSNTLGDVNVSGDNYAGNNLTNITVAGADFTSPSTQDYRLLTSSPARTVTAAGPFFQWSIGGVPYTTNCTGGGASASTSGYSFSQ